MVEIRNILVPTDFSTTADAAFEYASAVAEKFGASLHVLHVLNNPLLDVPMTELHETSVRLHADLQRDARARLDRIAAAVGTRGRPVTTAVHTGDPATQIIAYAAANAIDLIVMGTHGRGAVAHIFLGSTAERTVRHAPCAVLTVGPRSKTRAGTAAAGSPP